MKIEDIKAITPGNLQQVIDELEDNLLLARINGQSTPSYALFNTKDRIPFGIDRDSVYRGINEEGNIVNLSAAKYCYSKDSRIIRPGILTIFPWDKLSKGDKKFLENKKEKITALALTKGNKRKLLGL